MGLECGEGGGGVDGVGRGWVNDPGILCSLKIHSTALMATFTTVNTSFMKEETMHFESVCTLYSKTGKKED
jgi:hypothetical protein